MAKQYDLIVVGGGISGACILWDATLRGMNVLLLEKGDFASGTTQATSKLIHGGLRYLKNLEFGLVRESLRERRLLARLAPHAVKPMPFFHPIYKGAKLGRFTLGLALSLYDVLSFDRNRGIPRHLRLPRHRWLSRDEALQAEPGLHPEDLQGAYIYYDYQNIGPERVCSDFIFSAVERGATARNYAEVKAIQQTLDGYSVTIEDRLTSKKESFEAKSVVNAAGPWADLVDRATSSENSRKIVRSMGIHLVTRRIAGDSTVVLHRKDGSHFFIIPWREFSLIGTTDSLYEGHPDKFTVPESEIQKLIEDVTEGLNAKLTRADVVSVYGGLRPLVEESVSVKDSYSASRKTEIEMHADKPGFFTVLGGKYTTSRHLAEKAVDQIAAFLGGTWKKCSTHRTALRTGDFGTQVLLKQKLFLERKHDRKKIETLISRYGLIADRMLSEKNLGVAFTLDNGEVYYKEELETILNTEMVKSIKDLLLRRTGIGTLGISSPLPFAEEHGHVLLTQPEATLRKAG